MKHIGVLLAAGKAGRMGKPKQCLPWPPNSPDAKPLVAAAFDAIAGVCDEMIVVVGHYELDVVQALGERPYHRAKGNLGWELFASIRCGLAAVHQLDPSVDALLHPADHPEVRRDTLELLIRAAAENPDCAVMPCYRDKGGHPVLIPASIAERVLGFQGNGGLRQFWLDRPDLCMRLPVDDPGVVFDVDTPSDYDAGVQWCR